jgi:hypothetical protein
MSKRIIGVCGLIGSGKDTIADYLVNIHQFRRESFANSLKDAVAAVFGWDREMLEGRSKSSREWRECVDTWWAERLGIPHLTPRWILQYWGTEVCRRAFHDDIWIAAVENKLSKSQDDIVISDCRFPNEIAAIKQQNGLVIRVKRGPDPEWYRHAEAVNAGPRFIGWALSKSKMEDYKIHPSETSWIGSDFDHVIDNNNSLDELYSQIDALLNVVTTAPDTLVPA